MSTNREPDSRLFAELAKARLRQIAGAVSGLAHDLGLGREGKYALLTAMGHSSIAGTEASSSAVQAERRTRQLVYQLAGELAGRYLEDSVGAAVDELATVLIKTPVRSLANFAGHLDLTSSSLLNPDSYETALAVLSLTSWAVLASKDHERRDPPPRERLVEEAESRGCFPDLSANLAEYLVAALGYRRRYQHDLSELLSDRENGGPIP